MRMINMILAALLVCGVAKAAQDTTIDVREVRNPNSLKTWLEANATDAEARLAAGGSVSDTLALVNANDAGTAQVTLQADKADDAGDKFGIVATDGSGLEIQSDATSKGTLATKASIESDGTITTLVGIDAIGAVDFDIGSADVLDVTITVSNGTVVIDDGTLTASADLVSTDDVLVGDDIAVTGAASVGETLAVTGIATFTAESVHNGGIDADYLTVDAGYGIDNKAAGTLMVGESTATKVEIADASVETEVQGTLDVHGGLDVNEEVTVDLDAADEEIVITQSSAAGTASTPLIFVNDDRTGATANEAAEASIVIDAEGVYGIAITDGALSVQGVTELTGALTASGNVLSDEIDAATATTLLVGKATATGVTIGATDADTTIAGDLVVTGLDIDSSAGAMTIGKATATSLDLGASDITTTVKGPLVIDGNTAKLWLGTNGYFQVSAGALQFVGFNSFTNEVDADITQ